MLKSTHAEFVYRKVCYSELKKFKNKPEIMEKILFLMQLETLMDGKRVFYKYKTYIYKDTIQIRFISDLLRIMPLTKISTSRRYNKRELRDIIANQEKIRKYTKLTDEKINKLVDEILTNTDFDSKYFVHKRYQNKMMRMYARYICYYHQNVLKGFLYTSFSLLTFAIPTTSILLVPFILTLKGDYSDQIIEGIKWLLGITLLFGIPWLLCTFNALQPTQYEKNIENKTKKELD